LTWTFEHDYLAGLLYKFVGIGPWEQIYMLFSLFLTATVTYHVLKSFGHYETFRSGVVAMLITFCNYAAICKYPGHFTLTIVHWAVISIILDFLTIKIFFEENKFSASFILSRIAVLFLCLGLELGYIAGMAFSSLTVTAIFLLICLIIQKRSFRKIFDWCKETICYAIRDFRFNLLNSGLLVVIVAAFLFYLPLVMQIFLISRHSTVEQYMMQTASLKRIFWPIFPFFNPAMFNVHCSIDPVKGMADTIYANCIG
jgi:hypothetical protein